MMPASMKTNDQQPTAATMDTQMKEQLRHSRNAAWLAQTGLSLVAVVALTTGSEYDSREFEERWSLAMTSMALIMGFMGAALHIFHIIGDSVFSSTRTGSSAMEEESQFVSSPLEAGLAFLTALVWILGVPIITSSAHHIAAGDYRISGISGLTDDVIAYGIKDANLYFSSWGGLIAAVYIMLNLARENFEIPPSKRHHTSIWVWLCVSSVVALGASSRLYSDITDCDSDDDGNCKDLRIGMGLSAASATMSLFLIAGTQIRQAPLHQVGMFSGAGVITIWAVGLAYLTFGNGPASPVGNLFFSTWTSFILSIVLTANHTKEVFSKDEGDGAEHRGGPEPTEGVDPTDNQTGPVADANA